MTTSGHQSQDALIDYDTLDHFKRVAVEYGSRSVDDLAHLGIREVGWSRGESCYVLEHPDFYSGQVIEGLGTKNRVLERMIEVGRAFDGRQIAPGPLYAAIAQDCVAMIVNDMITLGIPPAVMGMHLAVGDSDLLKVSGVAEGLAQGWAQAVCQAAALWGYGETPTLKDIVAPGTIELSGHATGYLYNKDLLVNPANIQPGDRIIGLASSGIHANGLTKARGIAEEFGYFTPVGKGGETYADRLLAPTEIYVDFLRQCQIGGIRWSYGINVTGHGWRKIMRANQPFTYRITQVPDWLPEFSFMAECHDISAREMYDTFNMGIGFIVIVRREEAAATLAEAARSGYNAMILGAVEEGSKRVVIEPHNLEYGEETLQVR